jgi:lysophospholipase L1-like esterase
MTKAKTILKNLLTLLVSSTFAFALLEAGLRIFQPFEFRVRGGEIVLPANAHYEFRNDNPGKLDASISHTKNSLGFRGEELPENADTALTIIVVGGSTTESMLISDGKTWVDLLGQHLQASFPSLWMNNAGLDGQSTFGHEVLMRDYISGLPAKAVLFLIGANDVGTEAPRFLDRKTASRISTDSPTLFVISLANKSEVLTLALNMWRYYKANRSGLTHDTEIDLARLAETAPTIPEDQRLAELNRHRNEYVEKFSERVDRLVVAARSMGAEPILLTQPALYGEAVDPVTGIQLGEIAVSNSMDGALAWELLELYNDATRAVAQARGIVLIDLAASMPKDSSLYYDLIHFSNRGSSEVAEIVAASLCEALQDRFPDYAAGTCVDFRVGAP